MGQEAFHQYYQDLYGDRWNALHAALISPIRGTVAVINPFNADQTWRSQVQGHVSCDWEGILLPTSSNQEPFPAPGNFSMEFYPYYLLDHASALAAQLLDLTPDTLYADFCAAPGGKSLVAMFKLQGPVNALLNEPSPDRCRRLKSNLSSYLPNNVVNKIKVTSYDGRRFGWHRPESFDTVLLDAPCSSERHVLLNQKELDHWKPKRSKQLSELQFSLLCSAFDAIKKNGMILYSTCALVPQENERQIERLIKKRPGRVEVISHPLLEKYFEKRSHGYLALPDRQQMGPLYCCLLRKIGDS
ncbi:MAG: RsmB/NOP family class I SAM-dependent RNA methyltransferase [Bdellovibrio sp.]|nr:RsmB/NOP family class I SAM-dependent RNA methyltransferase [Bdellovibrio sp.]